MFPVTHLTEWKFMQNLRKCRSVLLHSSDLAWTSPPKKESALNKNSILWCHLWQRSLQTKCTILCSFSSLISWITAWSATSSTTSEVIVAQNRVSNFFSGSAMGLNKECQFSWLYFLWRLAFLIVGASKKGKESDFNLLFHIYKCTSLSTERFSRGPRNKCFQIPSTLLWILGECEGE